MCPRCVNITISPRIYNGTLSVSSNEVQYPAGILMMSVMCSLSAVISGLLNWDVRLNDELQLVKNGLPCQLSAGVSGNMTVN